GAGMVLKVDILERAIADNLAEEVILLTPDGTPFTQALAQDLAGKSSLTLVCGRYEGFDARVETLATRLVSIGDYVLMGGELAAGVIIEATARLLPGVLGDPQSAQCDSFTAGVLDNPEYTRPLLWRDLAVPEILLSGHHAQVARWRRREALRRTLERRPDLLEQALLSEEDREILQELRSSKAGD
ncbi:MAG: tRNA (guanosine(37)-N1)-methyltransferase TrmD, partial [Deinococcus sp.]|nr:tRNA (guanosine(37)-N1)-methyltransferase TrmD [Deinococcus sp.]